jgi:transcriptional regulator with XRE-family HTH domain
MAEIDLTFSRALKSRLGGHGSLKALAQKTNLSNAFLSQLINGKRHGTDKTRRSIAGALGYPGRLYEDFLDFGREGPAAGEGPSGGPVFEPLPKWLESIYAELKSLDGPARKAVIALVKGLADKK